MFPDVVIRFRSVAVCQPGLVLPERCQPSPASEVRERIASQVDALATAADTVIGESPEFCPLTDV